ncbi:hypothetical protein [Sphingomonas astaxanthinifaciens]|uniref:hypothetical protein n=1 Tax=Sphingomonas astaxanthinifaciens TaxID=407019 RepID=UPI0012EBBABE|nr:hypothetical protein [Sphingomonas astaxanthinifaciens]
MVILLFDRRDADARLDASPVPVSEGVAFSMAWIPSTGDGPSIRKAMLGNSTNLGHAAAKSPMPR